MYSRSWDCQYENPSFDKDQDEPDLPKQPEIRVRSDLVSNETGTTSGTTPDLPQNCFPKSTGYMTEPIGIMILTTHGTALLRVTTLILPTPGANFTVCVITRNRTATKITDTGNFVSQRNVSCETQDVLRCICEDDFRKFPIPITGKDTEGPLLPSFSSFSPARNWFSTQPHYLHQKFDLIYYSELKITNCKKIKSNKNYSALFTGHLTYGSSTTITMALVGPGFFKVPVQSRLEGRIFFQTASLALSETRIMHRWKLFLLRNRLLIHPLSFTLQGSPGKPGSCY